jgi:hypothetical protein
MTRTQAHEEYGLKERPVSYPQSWDELTVDPPESLGNGISPGEVISAAEDCDTLYEVRVELRTSRSAARLALNKLNITDELSLVSVNELVLSEE